MDGDAVRTSADVELTEENGGHQHAVLTASELAEGDSGSRVMITGAKAYRRSPSKDGAHTVALRKALTKDRHQSKSGRGRGAPKKGLLMFVFFCKTTHCFNLYVSKVLGA